MTLNLQESVIFSGMKKNCWVLNLIFLTNFGVIFNNSRSFDFVFAQGLRIFRSVILGEIKELNNFHQSSKYFFRFHIGFSIALGIVNDKRKVIGRPLGSCAQH